MTAWPGNLHVVAARQLCAVLGKIRESHNFAVTQIVTCVERRATGKALASGIVVSPVEAKNRGATGPRRQAQRAAQRRHEYVSIGERILLLVFEKQLQRGGIFRLLGRFLHGPARYPRAGSVVQRVRETRIADVISPPSNHIKG